MTNNHPPATEAQEPADGGLSPDQALALDYVLGILTEPLLSEAVSRYEDEEGFALLVASYRARLDAEDDAIEIDAPDTILPFPETWAAIAARTGADEQG